MDRWDYVLVAAVTLQASLLAYLHAPRWKALVLLIPLPFTVAALAVGRPIDATNVWGLVLLYCFTHAVRLLHYRFGADHLGMWPRAGLLRVGAAAAPLLRRATPSSGPRCCWWPPWRAWPWRRFRSRKRRARRTELPPWIKLPAIAAVVLGLVLVKNWLQEFATAFPMVGVIAAYEARNCLGTVCRASPWRWSCCCC